MKSNCCLYTFIFEFCGGTYIQQVKADNEEESIVEWLKSLREQTNEIYNLGEKTFTEIYETLSKIDSDDKPVLLDGLVNVWCLSLSTKKGPGLINIVKTQE